MILVYIQLHILSLIRIKCLLWGDTCPSSTPFLVFTTENRIYWNLNVVQHIANYIYLSLFMYLACIKYSLFPLQYSVFTLLISIRLLVCNAKQPDSPLKPGLDAFSKVFLRIDLVISHVVQNTQQSLLMLGLRPHLFFLTLLVLSPL